MVLALFLEFSKVHVKILNVPKAKIELSWLFDQISLENLKEFKLIDSDVQLDDVGMRALANGCPNLESVDFSGTSKLDTYLLEQFIIESG